MLLTNTAGFGYLALNEKLKIWGYPAGLDEKSGNFHDMKQPLLFQPGEGWEYGASCVFLDFRVANIHRSVVTGPVLLWSE